MDATSSMIGTFSPRVLVPQVMSYPSTVIWSIGAPITPLYQKVGSVQPLWSGNKAHALLNKMWSSGSFLVETWIRSCRSLEVTKSPPKEFLSSSLDTTQRRQIQFQKNSLFSGHLLEVFDGCLCLVDVPGGNVHLGVLGQQCLRVVRSINSFNRRSDRGKYLGRLFTNSSVPSSDDDNFPSQIRDVVRRKLGLWSEVSFDGERLEHLPKNTKGGEKSRVSHI